MTSCAAEAIAWAPEPQTRFTVNAGTSTGSPPEIAACRGRVHLIAGLDDIAHHYRLDLGVVELRPRQDGANGRGAQLRRRRLFQAAAEGANWGANRSRDNNGAVGHGRSPIDSRFTAKDFLEGAH